jgi:hypothetical protein
METIIIFAVTLIILDVLALKWGANSRDGIKESPITMD